LIIRAEDQRLERGAIIGAASLIIELIPRMDETAPKRGVPPVKTGPSLSAVSSFDLVLRANAGDNDALEALCARYLPRLQRWAHGRIPPAARGALQTHDLVQDTLLRVVERLPSFQPRHEGAFQGYVRTALWNRIRDIARQYQHTGPSDPLGTDMAGKEDSPLDLAIGSETLERYEAALDRLRPEEKELIIARIEMGLPHAEIAAMFEKPSVAAVHMALSRALVRLAEEMAHERRR
jgi:RNA polymerase sigma-70 factor, ECF subfamily